MGRTRTDGPDELEPSKFDCSSGQKEFAGKMLSFDGISVREVNGTQCTF